MSSDSKSFKAVDQVPSEKLEDSKDKAEAMNLRLSGAQRNNLSKMSSVNTTLPLISIDEIKRLLEFLRKIFIPEEQIDLNSSCLNEKIDIIIYRIENLKNELEAYKKKEKEKKESYECTQDIKPVMKELKELKEKQNIILKKVEENNKMLFIVKDNTINIINGKTVLNNNNKNEGFIHTNKYRNKKLLGQQMNRYKTESEDDKKKNKSYIDDSNYILQKIKLLIKEKKNQQKIKKKNDGSQ